MTVAMHVALLLQKKYCDSTPPPPPAFIIVKESLVNVIVKESLVNDYERASCVLLKKTLSINNFLTLLFYRAPQSMSVLNISQCIT